jgi:hypothetical protein
MRRIAVLLLAPLLLVARPAAAQSPDGPWFARAVIGWASFGNLAETDDPAPGESEALGLGGSSRWGLGVGRRLGTVELALDVQRGGHPVEARDDDVRVGVEPGLTLTTIALTVGYPIWRPATGARVSLLAGPLLSIWTGDFTTETQVRFGALAGVGVTAPVAGPLSLDARGTLAVSGSPITEDDLSGLESSYDRPAYLSPGIEVGVRVSF